MVLFSVLKTNLKLYDYGIKVLCLFLLWKPTSQEKIEGMQIFAKIMLASFI